MNVRVLRLDDALHKHFFRLHEEGGGWCFCVAWDVPTWDGWERRTARENRALRERRFDEGEHDGYLLLLHDEPAAWCRCAPRDGLPKLAAAYGLAPEPAVWAVSCFLVAPRLRGRGLAGGLLTEVLRDLPARGARAVEAYPRRGLDLPADDVWTGPESLFRTAGFVLVRDHASRPLYRLEFAASTPEATQGT